MTIISTGVATSFIDFTRASNATVTDSDGKVKWAPHNLLTNSESFASSPWTTYLATIASNDTVAPNGTTTADKYTYTGAGSAIYYDAIVPVGTHTAGCFFKLGTIPSTCTLSIASVVGNGIQATFNLSTQSASVATLGTGGTASGGSAAISSVGNGWFLCTLSGVATAGTNAVLMGFNGSSSQTGYLWGAHLYRSDLAMQPNTSAYPMYNPTTPKNLLGYTNLTAGWLTQLGATITPNNLLAPDGLYTGAKIAFSSDALSAVYQSVTGFGTYTISAWLRGEVGGEAVRFSYYNATNGQVNSSTITLTTTWTRYSWSASPTANSAWYISNTSATAKTLYAWGAQLSDSASLDSYVPVYGAAVTSAAYYGPRRDFDSAGVCKGLLVEEQRANLLWHSAAFDNAYWAKYALNTTGTPAWVNVGVAPDGTGTAEKLIDTTAANDTPLMYHTDTLTAAAYTFSIYAKAAERSIIYLRLDTGGAKYAYFNLSTGVASNVNAAYTAAITPVGNGWYRCSVTTTATVASYTSVIGLAITAGTPTYTGDGTSGVLVYGAQLELGSFATSYIPTGAATATRNADVASVSTQAFPYSATEGTWVANFQTVYSGTAASTVYFLNLDGSASKRVLYVGSGSDVMASYDGTTIVSSTGDVTGSITKSASAYSGTDRAVVSNGGTVATGAIAAGYATASTAYLGSIGSNSGTGPVNGHIRQITYLPRRLSNTELQTRTA